MCKSVCGILVAILAWPALAQQPRSDSAALSLPVNHESGVVSEVLIARDGGYSQVGSIVRWHDAQIFVSGSPSKIPRSGDSLDFTVYRSVQDGRKILRFETNQDSVSASDEEESVSSRASISSGSAKVENVLSADSDGYRFAAYQVTWHGARVVVIDPLAREPRAIGGQINFRVSRSGSDENRQLAFTLTE
jgi:hypothetical protein